MEVDVKKVNNSRSWDYFSSENGINDLFSKHGINNYTQKKKYDINELITISEKYEEKKIDNIPIPNKHRMIISTPFQNTSVVSYGLIVIAKDTERCAVVQNKHTVEYILIFKGFFRKTFLKFLLSKVMKEEADIIIKCLNDDTSLFIDIYLNVLNLEPDGLLYALVRMADSREEILKIIPVLDLATNTLPWNWPKGRTKISWMKEGILECAKREFFEETEIKLPPPINISKNYISEQITTVTGRLIEARYWIYIIPNEISFFVPTINPEVIDRKWVDIDTCCEIIPQTLAYKKYITQML